MFARQREIRDFQVKKNLNWHILRLLRIDSRTKDIASLITWIGIKLDKEAQAALLGGIFL